VELKRKLQEQATKKLQGLSEKQQLELLRQKFGHLTGARTTRTKTRINPAPPR
jgi:hypothetical protein